MSIEALTHSDAGERRVPETPDDWQNWVSATGARNHAQGNGLLDWLDLYGKARGFRRDEVW